MFYWLRSGSPRTRTLCTMASQYRTLFKQSLCLEMTAWQDGPWDRANDMCLNLGLRTNQEVLMHDPNLDRSFSEPDLNTGYQLPPERFYLIRPNDSDLVGLRISPNWWSIDLRTEVRYYKLSCPLSLNSLKELRDYGIDGNPSVKRLRF